MAKVDVSVDESLGEEQREIVVAAARELLANVAKHAGAASASLEVVRAGDDVVIRVSDDGHGIPAGRRSEALEQGHVGLAALTEHARDASGSLTVATGPTGTEVRVIVPASPAPERRTSKATVPSEDSDFHALLDRLPQMIWVVRPDGTPEYRNERLRAYLGVPDEDAGSTKGLSDMHPDDVAGVYAAWQDAFSSGSLFEHSWRMRRADGEYRLCAVRALAMHRDDGSIERWIGTLEDIHDRAPVAAP